MEQNEILKKAKDQKRQRWNWQARLPALTLILCMTLAMTGCAYPNQSYTKSGLYFNTIISITLYEKDTERDQKLAGGCFALAEKYENLLSNTVATSDISRINSSPYQKVTVDEDTADILETALYYCQLSQGRFDITVGKLTSLWDFSGGNTTVPDTEELAKEAAGVDYTCIELSGNTVCLHSDACQIDLGAIAKGYIADRMKEYLIAEGVESALINLGGNVVVVGAKPDGSAYQIGIQKPFSEDGEVITSVFLKDQSVVTSGPYQRYFEQDGIIYHHILDPATGYPVQNNLGSVSIISDQSAECDALSTICYIYGLEDGRKLIESLDGVEAIFVLDDDSIIKTSGLA